MFGLGECILDILAERSACCILKTHIHGPPDHFFVRAICGGRLSSAEKRDCRSSECSRKMGSETGGMDVFEGSTGVLSSISG